MLKVVEPVKLAKNQAKLEGVINSAMLPRIHAELHEPSEISYSLDFYSNEQGHCVIDGRLTCEVALTCYRCLNICQQSLNLSFKLIPVHTLDESEALPVDYEPVLLHDNLLNLDEILEEEILLGLPLVPKHALNDPNCLKNNLFVEEVVTTNVRPNPFKDLDKLTKIKT